jgi:hypothetical protein
MSALVVGVWGSLPPVYASLPDPGTISAAPDNASAGETPGAGSTFDNIEILDETLKSKLSVSRVGSQPGSNNLLSVFVTLKNMTARRLDFEVETVYKDSGGNPLNHASWIPMTLKALEERTYRSSSISEQAEDFLVRVRRTRK